MSVTQREIAAKLNVSQAHVARALSGSSLVSAKTRLRIEQTAREMGYDPDANSEARGMNARRHGKPLKKGTIAMLFHFLGDSPRALPFYTAFLDGVEEAVAANDSNLCLCLIRVAELPRLIRERNVDGVIVLGEFPQLSAEIKSIGLPVVSFHMHFEGISSVHPDDKDGARQATRHLFEQGHRRIGYIGVRGGGDNPSLLRYQGYLEAMKECDLSVRDEWIVNDFATPQPTADTYCDQLGHCNRCAACCGWAQLVEQNEAAGMAHELPTALICHNDHVAMGVAENAGRDGLIVPQDLSLIGFDDISVQYRFQPALTSIALPLREMGHSAVQLLQELGQEPDQTKALHSVLPVNLVIRESTPDIRTCALA